MAAIGAAIAAASTAFKASALGVFLATTTGRLLSTVAILALQVAIAPKPHNPGIQTEQTTAGGTNPVSFVLGRYATAGNAVCPAMSHSDGTKTPNGYLTYVIDLGDIPGGAISRLEIDGKWVLIGTVLHPLYGRPLLGDYEGYAWVRFRTGNETTADPVLRAIYGAYPERPWTAGMIGRGMPQAILTFKLNQKLMPSFPQVLFEWDGIVNYDPRLDSSVGGSGAQRWDDKGTWAVSSNPMVLIYNIMRGIDIPGLGVWGGLIDAEDLPLGAWFAVMNECDVAVPRAGGGSEPAFRAGIEVKINETPAEVIDALKAACGGDLADIGGVWKPRVGGPALPVLYLDDDDIVISRTQEFRPFPALDARHNAVTASYPEPETGYKPKAAPPIYNPAWEAEDGGRRLELALSLPAVTSGAQVQRVMRSAIGEARRFREHSVVLPPDTAFLEPLDAVAWNSARYQYTAKTFEVYEAGDDQVRLLQALALRERDGADHVWLPEYEQPFGVPSRAPVLPAPQSVPGWDLIAFTLLDASGTPRRPALQPVWEGEDQDDVRGLQWEVRIVGTTTVTMRGSVLDVSAGKTVISDGVLPDVEYEARGQFVVDRATVWSAWKSARTPNLRVTAADLDPSLSAGLDTAYPSVPTGLALSTALVGGQARITASVTANPAGEAVAYYVFLIREGAGAPVAVQSSLRSYTWVAGITRGAAYSISAYAVRGNGFPSAPTAEETITAAADTVAPAAMTGLAATAGFGVIWLTWVASAADDLARYEIYESATTTAPLAGAAASFSSGGVSFPRDGLGNEQTRHYWVRAVDTSGNAGAWSARASATTLAVSAFVNAASLAGVVDAASFAAGVRPVELVAALPGVPHVAGRVVVRTTDWKLFRNTGAGWTAAADGADLLANSVSTVALAAGAVTTEQLAARAIITSKLAVTSTENLWPDGSFAGRDEALFLHGGSAGSSFFWSPTSRSGGWSLALAKTLAGGSSFATLGPDYHVPVQAGQVYWAECAAFSFPAAASAGFYYRVSWFDAAGAALGYTDVASNSALATTWEVFSAKVTAPVSARFARWDLLNWTTNATTNTFYVDRVTLRLANAAELILDGGLTANMVTAGEFLTLSAQIRDAIITNAKIVELSAAKLMAGTALAGSITVSGTALATVEQRAGNPAAQVNAAATLIDPGKIFISGGTTLGDWRYGGDFTRINGGALGANSVAINALTIGSRNVATTGLLFEHNDPATNSVSWTAGTIRYTNDAGAVVSRSIAAGNAAWASGVLYLYWVKDSTALSVTTNQATAFTDNTLVLATYSGGVNLNASVGRTVIDATGIRTPSLSAISANLGVVTAGVVQSPNFVTGISGARIDLTDGSAEFAGPVISRDLVIDSGFATLPASIAGGGTAALALVASYWIETGTPITAWVGNKEALTALVGRRPGAGYGSVTADSGDVLAQPQNIQWGWEASVVPVTRWSGNQRIWIRVDLWCRLVSTLVSFQLEWKLARVT